MLPPQKLQTPDTTVLNNSSLMALMLYTSKKAKHTGNFRMCFSNCDVANSPSPIILLDTLRKFLKSPFLDYSFETVPSVATYEECPFPDVSFDT